MKKYIGKEAQLISKPDGHTSRDYALTVGKWYTIRDFSGSNVITNSDEDGINAHYWAGRLDLANCREPEPKDGEAGRRSLFKELAESIDEFDQHDKGEIELRTHVVTEGAE